MNPLKRRDISQKTADQLGLPVELVDDIVSFFYKSVQQKLSSLDHININVPRLGTFCLKKKGLLKKLEKYEKAVVKLENHIEEDKFMSLRKYSSIVEMKHHISNFKNALDILDQEQERKKQKQKERKEYEAKSNSDLEDEGKDSRRNQK